APSSSVDDLQVAGVDVLGLAVLVCDGIHGRRSRVCAAAVVGGAFVIRAGLTADVDCRAFFDLAGLMQERGFHGWPSSCVCVCGWKTSPRVVPMAMSSSRGLGPIRVLEQGALFG